MATAAAVNESRGDLLSWINELLQLNVTKVESIGTGAVLCQIMDSIYGDVQMHKVKFNTNQEYEYVNNFKVLQACFTAHGVDKGIPVERLTKLKFQDNLEFLQWMKKFWDANFPGGPYDAVARRKGITPNLNASFQMTESPKRIIAPLKNNLSSGPLANFNAPSAAPNNRSASFSALRYAPASRSGLIPSGPTPPGTPASGPSVSQLQQTVTALNRTLTELRLTVDEMERERDFYFEKLREIEIASQLVSDPPILDSAFYKSVTEVLYKTDDDSNFVAPTTSAATEAVSCSIANESEPAVISLLG